MLFAVKLGDSEAAAASCRPLLGPNSALIMLQNGVDGVARLAPILGLEAVVGGVAYISSFIEKPGTIGHHGDFARLQFGEAGGGGSDRLERFLEARTKAACTVLHSLNPTFKFNTARIPN